MFTVKIEPAGHTFTARENETVLDAALRQGVHLPYGCRGGACGACKATLLTGKVHYETRPDGITDEDIESGLALLCQAKPCSDLGIKVREIEKSMDIAIKKYPCRVEERIQLNHDVLLIKLKLPETERMPFFAGQYIDFILQDGRHRSFSIANAPHDDKYIELHIRHIPGGEFTTEAFTHMKTRDMFRIEGPKGQFYLREDSSRPMIFMAGGTGFAPVKGIIEHTLHIGSTRPIHLYWGVRTLEDLYMKELAGQWAAEHEHIHFIPVLSDPKPHDNWSGRTGLVNQAILDDFDDLSGYEMYGSGPPKMVYAGQEMFPEKGLDLEHYFSDAFEFQKD